MKKNVIVIKFGGSILHHTEHRRLFFLHIKQLIKLGYMPVIVHGGGKEISSWSEKIGLETRFVHGLRYTDKKTIEIVEMVLSGKVNKQLTSEINHIKIPAVGISCRDAQLITAKQKKKYGFIGKPNIVKPDILFHLGNAGYVPVISSVAADSKGHALNVNADDAASSIAIAMKAKRLIFMTDTPGILKNIHDIKSRIPEIHIKHVNKLIKNGTIKEGMIPKIISCRKAIKKGVEEVDIVDGRVNGILMTCFKNKKISGTRIKRDHRQ